jgi:FkbM family methyltransferase
MQLSSFTKSLIKKALLPEGSIRTVLLGPCRGIRYRVFPGYGRAYVYGGWERKLARLMTSQIRRGSTVYDLGANYGMHTLLFGRLVGPSGRVYAFEPHPEIFSCLKDQLNLNAFGMVVPVCEAVCERTGFAFFDEAHARSVGHLTDSVLGALKVKTTTLDDFVFRGHASPPDFIKIDIEGAEGSALRGAQRTLQHYRPRMVIELHNPIEDRAVGAILADLNYSAFRIHDGSRVADIRSGWPDLAGMWGTVLAIPDEFGSGSELHNDERRFKFPPL